MALPKSSAAPAAEAEVVSKAVVRAVDKLGVAQARLATACSNGGGGRRAQNGRPV